MFILDNGNILELTLALSGIYYLIFFCPNLSIDDPLQGHATMGIDDKDCLATPLTFTGGLDVSCNVSSRLTTTFQLDHLRRTPIMPSTSTSELAR